LERLGGDEALVNEVVEIFLNDMPGQLRELREALHDQDAEKVRQKAHRIKGASANIGAQAVSGLALKIEMAGKQGDLIGTSNLLENLEEEIKGIGALVCSPDGTDHQTGLPLVRKAP
jgi:HPt (histidine-containing phosphotransfer) domain-containing protein